MTNAEKISKIQAVQSTGLSNESIYYNLLEEIGDIQYHYYDYVSQNVDEELKRLPNADYHLCCCLLTLILREDHFCNSFDRRYNSGIVAEILNRMILLLEKTA
ncbi:MAG: hypothetical protein IJ740_14165 [Ruminococcus sp.]|nr:hypothetical protein [Ruminococcus sp.]